MNIKMKRMKIIAKKKMDQKKILIAKLKKNRLNPITMLLIIQKKKKI